MILESYYVDGCKMEEIAKRVGYRNGNSVKSRKNKVLRKIMEMMKKDENERGQADDFIGSAKQGQTYPAGKEMSDFSCLPMAA